MVPSLSSRKLANSRSSFLSINDRPSPSVPRLTMKQEWLLGTNQLTAGVQYGPIWTRMLLSDLPKKQGDQFV